MVSPWRGCTLDKCLCCKNAVRARLYAPAGDARQNVAVRAATYGEGHATDATVVRKLVGVCDVLRRTWALGRAHSGLASEGHWLGPLGGCERRREGGAGQVFSKMTVRTNKQTDWLAHKAGDGRCGSEWVGRSTLCDSDFDFEHLRDPN